MLTGTLAIFAVGPAVRTTHGRTVTGPTKQWKLMLMDNHSVTVRPSVVRTAGPTANIAGVLVIVE